MLPRFTITEHNKRFFVETDWHVAVAQTSRMTYMLQVTTSGKLDTASAGWSTKAKAQAAIEQCKARIR